MLSNDVQETPRPRPPAKARARRSLSAQSKASPPPPYARTLETLLGSPIVASAQLAGWDSPARDTEEWINERSKEELSELLLKAGGIIKDRENELGLTTTACKDLYENNIVLKNKHKALLARLPASPFISPIASPIIPSTPHYYSASLSRASNGPSLPSNLSNMRHTRRISVSPSDIALLSDQNAELLQKLEKLETESSQADQAGRRKLRKLEKEIQILKDELEKTQAKSEELEEKAKHGFLEEAKRREERDERLRALRRKSTDGKSEEVKDFAPGGPLTSSIGSFQFPSPRPSTLISTPPHAVPPELKLSTKPTYSPVPDSPISTPLRSSLPQHTLVAQLLNKIRELEETNTQITAQQVDTAVRLQAVQRDAENISKVYECFGEDTGVQWEVANDDPSPTASQTKGTTIRFRSLRRTIDGNMTRLLAEEDANMFENGISRHSTFRNADVGLSAPRRPRRSLAGLFDPPESGTESPESLLSIATERALPVPFFPPDEDDVGDISWASAPRDADPLSPALSTLSISTPLSPTLLGAEPIHTLGSELGSEFGDDCDAGSHHLRMSSLYDLRGAAASSPPSPSPSPPASIARPLWPMTPSPLQRSTLQVPGDSPTPAPTSKQSLRYRRMSQTVHMRTSQWIDGRFGETLLGRRGKSEVEIKKASTRAKEGAMPPRLASAFNLVVDRLTGGSDGEVDEVAVEDGSFDLSADSSVDEGDLADTSAVELHVGTALRPEGGQKQRGLAAFVLEMWLWLQFAVIILVFLWAMARRGPKSMLEEAEKRRVSRSTR